MIIKNVIVLLDEINVQRHDGVIPYTAVIEATVSRYTPGTDGSYYYHSGYGSPVVRCCLCGMAATIFFGLTFATLLTLFITPALYSMFYKVKES